MVEGGKSRVLFRRVRRRETMECEDLVKEVRRGRLLCRRGGCYWVLCLGGRLLIPTPYIPSA